MSDIEINASRVGKMLDPDTWGKNVQYIMEKFLETASVERAYGHPITQGDYMIIPAAEVVSAAGYGVGLGGGYAAPEDLEKDPSLGGGGGGGGGGRVITRPVAVIIAGPNGVWVEPVMDYSKLWIAALTAVGFMVATFFRMRAFPGSSRRAMKNGFTGS